ncbi:Predicted arabinose efflux permease, MFS family [Propionibacterium cyclohexanicum]|uniref:Predicted arabinose efflux permease, MFS family n=1 Tax=Propionibacterium cyclohexanicum TaxID=64702 RepID=A0A1H9RHW2_9ACTN|nr:MFS transporter [Propionibacterium cyclohexanicum]SER72302.1 Predicted arabinose efflux permease, MFS family [Propionibacterium cyclohexanicum]
MTSRPDSAVQQDETALVRRRPGVAIAVGGVLAFLVGSDSMVVAPIAPAMLSHWGTGIAAASLLISAYALGYAMTSPVFGAMADRTGRRRVAVSGIVVFAVGTALTGFAPGFGFALASRAVAGIGAGSIMPVVFGEVSARSTQQTRGANIGLVTSLMPLSTVLGVPLGALLASAVGWQWVFHVIAIPALVCLVPAARIFEGMPQQPSEPRASSAISKLLATTVTNPLVLLVFACTFLWTGGQAVLFTSIGAFYHTRFAVSTAGMSGIVFAVGIAGTLASVFGSRLLARCGARTYLVICGVIAIAGVLTMVLAPGLQLSVLGNFVWSVGVVAGTPALTTLAATLDPRAQGTVLALNGSAQYLAQFAAASVAALVVALTHNYTVLGLIAAALALTTVFTSRRLKERA